MLKTYEEEEEEGPAQITLFPFLNCMKFDSNIAFEISDYLLTYLI